MQMLWWYHLWKKIVNSPLIRIYITGLFLMEISMPSIQHKNTSLTQIVVLSACGGATLHMHRNHFLISLHFMHSSTKLLATIISTRCSNRSWTVLFPLVSDRYLHRNMCSYCNSSSFFLPLYRLVSSLSLHFIFTTSRLYCCCSTLKRMQHTVFTENFFPEPEPPSACVYGKRPHRVSHQIMFGHHVPVYQLSAMHTCCEHACTQIY